MLNNVDIWKEKTEGMEQVNIDFIGIGAQKSGTSWLHYNLNKLPDFDLPPRKELHYFDRDPRYPSPNTLSVSTLPQRLKDGQWTKKTLKEFMQALSSRDLNKIKWVVRFAVPTYSDEWYLSIFRPLKGIKGEITPSYSILDPGDIERMHRLAPQAKLIFMLRNPVERAWSSYRYSREKEGNLDHPQDTAGIIRFFNTPAQLKRSDYLTTLSNYLRVYPAKQILLGFYDAIADRPEELLKEVVRFLGGRVENVGRFTDYNKRINVSRPVDCPEEVRAYLKEMYYSQIRQLSGIYGGYFSVWLESTYGEKKPAGEKMPPATICLGDLDRR